MKKTLYLMRHGQTLFNLQHKIQGWCDSPLTELGIKQAKVAGEYFKKNNIKFDKAFSSTSERACDTLEIVTEGKLDYQRLKGLKEWNFGKYEGKDEFLNPPLPYGEFFKLNGGESEIEVKDRMFNTIKDVLDKEDGEVFLMVSHGGACVQFTRKFDDTSTVHFTRGFRNCSIFKIEYENGVFDLVDIIQHDFSGIENN